jgi:hypothetical protein
MAPGEPAVSAVLIEKPCALYFIVSCKCGRNNWSTRESKPTRISVSERRPNDK